MDYQLGAADVIQEFRRDFRELGLVAQELAREPMDFERTRLALALGIEIAVEVVAGETSIDELDAANLDDPVAQLSLEARRLGVQDYLSHIFNRVSRDL